MATDDIIDLVMSLAKQQMNIVEYREDELIYIIKIIKETITLTDSVTVIKAAHPVKYDEVIAIYDRCTYG